MKLRVVVLGAGFGGLELTSILSDSIGDRLDLTLIDKNETFYFGFSKLDVMFGRKTPAAVRQAYRDIVKPGVRFSRETVVSIDPVKRIVTTDQGTHEADILVVALGADYDLNATPGLAAAGHEFYSMAGAERIRELLPTFTKGNIIIGISAIPYKCPPAPSEAALLLHDYLSERGVRDACTISLISPQPLPVPPSPEASQALLSAFAERGIQFMPNSQIRSLDATRKVVLLDNETEIPFDLYLGIPKHVAPAALAESGLLENGWIPVDRGHLKTRFHNVYAVGDVTSVGTAKAGVFAEGAARSVAASIIAEFEGTGATFPFNGKGYCYIEFGHDRVGTVNVDFFSGPKPVGIFNQASEELAKDKKQFGSSRILKWFGK